MLTLVLLPQRLTRDQVMGESGSLPLPPSASPSLPEPQQVSDTASGSGPGLILANPSFVEVVQ